METTLTTVPSTLRQLYPVQPDAAAARLLDAVCLRERDANGNLMLRRRLDQGERRTLSSRLQALQPHVEPAGSKAIAKLVTQLLAGYGSARASGDEAQVVTAQYATALRGLPLWAIERACGRFSRGEVTAAEVNAKHIDHAYPPSCPQLRMVAARISDPVFAEAVKIGMTLRGTVEERPPTPEERARVSARFDDLVRRHRMRSVADAEAARPPSSWAPPTDDAMRASLERMARKLRDDDLEEAAP